MTLEVGFELCVSDTLAKNNGYACEKPVLSREEQRFCMNFCELDANRDASKSQPDMDSVLLLPTYPQAGSLKFNAQNRRPKEYIRL